MADDNLEYPEERENQDELAPGFQKLEDEQKDAPKDEDIVMGTDADVTEEDKENLGDKDHDMDMGDDEAMEGKGLDDVDSGEAGNLDRTGDDLDVPGSELDDDNEDIGEEDEENNYYSQSDN